ncbi:uncharacterized protein B0H64DRAFT_166575 [Chaetomium fimeti]|uniref:Uncharacterized protein n=1 Tax=Chaetomium fimeti TaxID=1854472 RepID=A0AAE0HGU3_9PEZI|nr:hypothetical protein B0H64DRAFT_166575 [Chaetomium fimeti]
MAGRRPIDKLPNVVTDVVITTAKTFRAARQDGKGNPAAAAAAMETRVPAAVEQFNAILDDIESEILLSKAVIERDLKLLRAKRQPPPPESKPVAPPAPMVIDLDSPKMTPKASFPGLPGPSLPGKQASKPVAPFPNMGFEGASPEVAAAPNPKAAPKPKDVKNQARPAGATGAAARSASAPQKKDVKVPSPHLHRPSGVATAPQTPLNASAQPKASFVATAAANRQASSLTPNASATSAATPPAPVAGNGNIFTDMTFSVAPPPGDTHLQNQVPQPQRTAPQQQPPPPGTSITNAGGGDVLGHQMEQFKGGPADVANMDVGIPDIKAGDANTISNVDDKIDGLFDLGPGDLDTIDLEYDLGNGDNSNFNDMYFPTGDNNGGAGEFDDAFFNLNG